MKIAHSIYRLLALCLLLLSSEQLVIADAPPALSQRTFWVWDLTVMPPAFRKANATLRASGSRSLIYVEEQLWNSNVTEKFVSQLSKNLETNAKPGSYFPDRGIVPLQEEVFAPLPTVINPDPRVIVLFADLGQYKNYKFDGFFNAFDQMKELDAWSLHQQHSNEANIIYINGIRESEAYTEGVIAHELQHLLAHHARPSNTPQELWLSEAIAEGAMLLTGHYTDQGHVDRYLENPAAHSLVSQTYVQYGPQLLFASFLIDSLKRAGGLGHLTRTNLTGKEAVTDLFRSRTGGAPQSFDAIYSLFLTYISDSMLSKIKLPAAWNHSEETGLILKNARSYGQITVPGTVEGKLVPYSFAPYTLEKNLGEQANVQVTVISAQGSCANGNGKALWKPLTPKMIAIYAVGCDQNSKEDTIQFRLTISEQPTIMPLSTIPFVTR